MANDWAAVAVAITERMGELGILQRDLADRAHVSQAIIRELQRNTVQRRRNTRTLEALSVALEWPPGHLNAIRRGKAETASGDQPTRADPVTERLDAIESRLAAMSDRLLSIDKRLGKVFDDGTIR